MMKGTQYIFALLTASILLGCVANKQLTTLTEAGNSAFEKGQYLDALSNYEQIISMNEKREKITDMKIFFAAGISAMMTGQNDNARTWLEKVAYRDDADEASVAALAQVYRKIDNLSKEIKTLELYLRKFPEGKARLDIQSRLFDTYVESENWEKGVGLYQTMDFNLQNKTHTLEGYLKCQQALNNEESADETANHILTQEKQNSIARGYYALKYYNRAEKLYQVEMEAYEQNKTNKQYKILLEKLRLVTTDFKKSRDYFEALYEKSKDPDQARYLAIIYARLNNKEKSEYYKELSKE